MGDEIRSAVDIAMSGERPMDSDKEQQPSGTPVRTAVEIAMAGGPRPMDSDKEQQPSGTPVRTAVEIAMAGGPRPMDSNTKQETQYSDVAPQSGSYESQGTSQTDNVYAENAKLKEDLEALKQQVEELSKKFDDPNALQDALDPNRTRLLNPLEEVQKTLLEQESDRQAKFAADVENARLKHDPTYNPNLIKPEVTTVTPEVTTTTPEIEKKQRDFKTAALIAGVVAGGAAGILGGTAVGIPVAAAAGVISIGGRISNYFLGRSLNKIAAQIEDPTLDPTTKERLLKRETNLKKIQNIVQHVTKFATGAAIGAGIANFISHAAMGGHGLVWNRPEVPEIPGGVPGAAEGNLGNTGIEQNPATPTGEGSLSGSPETYPGNSFIKDNRINLPGDAIDGTMAQAPYEGAMPQSEISANMFAGGNHNKAAWEIGEWLKANNITDSELNILTQYDKHRLFYDNVLRTQAGQSVDPIAVLQNLGTPGAQEFLKVIPVK